VRAEVNPRLDVPHLGPGAPSVDGLLKERDARLPPQSLPEQKRRAGRRCQHRSGRHESDVVESSELLRADLKVHLEARVRRLEHHVVVLDQQLVHALEVELVSAAAQTIEGVVQRVVALLRRHVLERKVGLVESRQDAGQDHVSANLERCLPHGLENLSQPMLHAAQAITAEG
jgi:hypothetical protein